MTPTSTEDEECKSANNIYGNRRTSHYSSYVCLIQVVRRLTAGDCSVRRGRFIRMVDSDDIRIGLAQNWAWDTEKFHCS